MIIFRKLFDKFVRSVGYFFVFVFKYECSFIIENTVAVMLNSIFYLLLCRFCRVNDDSVSSGCYFVKITFFGLCV